MIPFSTIDDPDHVARLIAAFQNHHRHPNPPSQPLGSTPTSRAYIMDGKVYVVTDGASISVYDFHDFRQAVRAGELPGYRPYCSMPVHEARLVFTQDEIDRNGAGCREKDEFVSNYVGSADLVVVTRDGKITNRWSDGTVGVPDDVRDLVEMEEEYYRPDTDESADTWRDCIVYDDGTVARFKESQNGNSQ